jgi:hypothetical protein
MWKALGEKETGAPAAPLHSRDEMCASGITVGKPLTLTLASTMGDPLAAGRWTARVITASGATDEAVELSGGKAQLTLRPGTAPCAVEIRREAAAQ